MKIADKVDRSRHHHVPASEEAPYKFRGSRATPIGGLFDEVIRPYSWAGSYDLPTMEFLDLSWGQDYPMLFGAKDAKHT